MLSLYSVEVGTDLFVWIPGSPTGPTKKPAFMLDQIKTPAEHLKKAKEANIELDPSLDVHVLTAWHDMASIWKKKQSEKKHSEYRGSNQSAVQCALGEDCEMNKTIEPHQTFRKCKDCDGRMFSTLCLVSLEEGVFLCAACGSMKQPAKKSDESTGTSMSLWLEKIESTLCGDINQGMNVLLFGLLKKV
jgi:hypothetical protein